jgi:hypothetical protein
LPVAAAGLWSYTCCLLMLLGISCCLPIMNLQDGYMDCLRWLQQGAPARKATREARRAGVAFGGLLACFTTNQYSGVLSIGWRRYSIGNLGELTMSLRELLIQQFQLPASAP